MSVHKVAPLTPSVAQAATDVLTKQRTRSHLYDPWGSACLDDAVGELECQGRRVVADTEGVGADDGGGDGGKVVGEEELGRGAAESVHGGVDPIGALCGLGELLEEEDHCGREGAGGLGSEQVHEVALRQRVAVVAGRGVDPANPRETCISTQRTRSPAALAAARPRVADISRAPESNKM